MMEPNFVFQPVTTLKQQKYYDIVPLCHNVLNQKPKKKVKTDSVQSSSNTCQNYLLKIYSQHANFLNAI